MEKIFAKKFKHYEVARDEWIYEVTCPVCHLKMFLPPYWVPSSSTWVKNTCKCGYHWSIKINTIIIGEKE